MNNLYKHTSYYQRGGPSYGGDYKNQRPKQKDFSHILDSIQNVPPEEIQRTTLKAGGLLSENDLLTGNAAAPTSVEQIQADRATYNQEALSEALRISSSTNDPEIKQRLSDISTFIEQVATQINQSDYNTSLQILQSYQSQMQQFFSNLEIQRYLNVADYLDPKAGRRQASDIGRNVVTVYGRPREDMVDKSIIGSVEYQRKIAGYRNIRNYAQLKYLDLKEMVMSKINGTSAAYSQQYLSQSPSYNGGGYYNAETYGSNVGTIDVGQQNSSSSNEQLQTRGNLQVLQQTIDTAQMDENQFLEKVLRTRVSPSEFLEKWKSGSDNKAVQSLINNIQKTDDTDTVMGYLETIIRIGDNNSEAVAFFVMGMITNNKEKVTKAWNDADPTYKQKMIEWLS